MMRCLKFLTCCLAQAALGMPNLPEKEISRRETQCSTIASPPLSSPTPIPNSQNVSAPAFLGSPVQAHRLRPKVRFSPDASLLHQDGGNTGSMDYPAPLGHAPNVFSAAEQVATFLWGADGSLTAAYAELTNSTMLKEGLAAVNPANLEISSLWFPPEENQALGFAYMELVLSSNIVIVPSKQGRIYVVSRQQCGGGDELTLQREIDLTSTISPGEQLLNSLQDAEGNIWFTSGGITGAGDPVQSSCTIGYVSPEGNVHAQHFQDQFVENGIAVNGSKMYVVTGPSGSFYNQTNATGYMYAFTTGSSLEPTTIWSSPYSAGSGVKPGGFARGSGSTPVLLGDQYVAITDNSDEQINLVVYKLNPAASGESQVHCTLPLFQKGASANEIALLVHQEGSTWGLVAENGWNYPPTYAPGDDINGSFNNMTGLAPGVSRIDVHPHGCSTRWELPIRVKSVPVLSTETGLYYGYTQDEDLAVEGEYVWYVVAVDWRAGEEVWRVKAGAGGTFNDDFHPGAIGPDGSFYQAVLGGVVRVKDGQIS